MAKMRKFSIGLALLITLSVVENQDSKLLECSHGSHRCADNLKCVIDKDLCDFNKDCDDLSDEGFSICRQIQDKRSPNVCPAGQIYSPQRACQYISDICNENSGYFANEFPAMCNEIKNGLKPFEEVESVRKEISAIREEESKLQELFAELATSFDVPNWTLNNSHCPPLYVNVGAKCVALFSIAQVPWSEAKQFCESISGTLAILSELSDYQELQKYLKDNDLSSNFWIGGQVKNISGTSEWKWLNNKNIEMGTPYWTLYKTPACTKRKNSDVCFAYSLMPQGIPDGCLALDYQYYYYFSDAHCYEKRSPLCIYN